MKIDLHCHTYYSDGSFSPTEVVDMALKKNVRYLAIADHNVFGGVPEAQKYAEGKPIIVIPGIEISSDVNCSDEEIHIVGLYINPSYRPLVEMSECFVESKRKNLEEIILVVNKHFGSNITLKEVQAGTRGALNRSHLGRTLFEKGLVKDIREGINLLLKGAPCYVERTDGKLHARESIKIIHGAGGIAILAHPFVYAHNGNFKTREEQEELVRELKSYGLDGMEVYTPDADEQDIQFALETAKKYNLKVSAGSDFHDEKFLPKNVIGFADRPLEEISVIRPARKR